MFGILGWLFGIKQTKKQGTIKTEIPDGYCLFPDDLDNDLIADFNFFVKGVHYRKANVIKWATGEDLALTHRREPSNKYDSNAIAIYGTSSNGKFKLGYVDADLAEVLVETGLNKGMKLAIKDVEITDKVSKEEKKKGFDMRIRIEYKLYVPCEKIKSEKVLQYLKDESYII